MRLAVGDAVELGEDPVLQQALGLGLRRAVDVDLGLDDRHQPVPEDLSADLELLGGDGGDALGVGHLDDRRIFVPNTPLATARASRSSRPADGLHDLRAVGLVGQALVDLQERHHLLDAPEVLGGALALDLPVHRLLEEDRPEDAVTVERRAGDDAGAHLVDEIEHLVVVRPCRLVEPVEPERLRGAAPALVEGGDEALGALDLLELFHVHA